MPGLGRLPEYDPRSEAFPIRSLFEVPKPLRSYTWRVNCWLDQGNTPTCVGHAMAHELIARPVIVDASTVDPFAIYHAAQEVDQWEGTAYDGTSVLAGAKVLRAQGHYSSYLWAQSETDIALAVGYHGPVVMGTTWTQDMFNPDRSGFIHPTGPVAGGHAYLVHSVNIRLGYYRIWNSWGQGWNVDGTAKIRRQDLAMLLADDGEGCLPVRQKIPESLAQGLADVAAGRVQPWDPDRWR